jgi:hypothetical protein
MRSKVFLFCLLALSAALLFGGYEHLKWDATYYTVRIFYPKITKVKNPCYFDGVNIFGSDTLRAYEERPKDPLFKKRVFLFQRKRLVAVEVHYEPMDLPFFEKRVVEPLKKIYGAKRMQTTTQSDNTKDNVYFIWKTRSDVVVAMWGHFKRVSPDNLDWNRVVFYKRSFYDLKNATRSSLAGDGEWAIYY